MKKEFLKNTDYESLSYFGLSYNSKHEKYNEGKYFIAIQLKTRNNDIRTTDIILNKDNSLKAILSELYEEHCIELFKWLIEWYYTENKGDMKTVIAFNGIEFLSKDGIKIEAIYSDELSKEDIEKYLLETLKIKGGNY